MRLFTRFVVPSVGSSVHCSCLNDQVTSSTAPVRNCGSRVLGLVIEQLNTAPSSYSSSFMNHLLVLVVLVLVLILVLVLLFHPFLLLVLPLCRLYLTASLPFHSKISTIPFHNLYNSIPILYFFFFHINCSLILEDFRNRASDLALKNLGG